VVTRRGGAAPLAAGRSRPSAARSSDKRVAARQPAAPGGLTLELIVQTAVQTIEKGGLGGLSMRQLASLLDVTPTAIYYHLRDKDALLDLCAQEILGRIPPTDPALAWPEQLRTLILQQQRLFVRYPGLARFLLVHRESSIAALHWGEAILAVLHGAGFGAADSLRVLMTLSFLINPITLIDEPAPRGKAHPVLRRNRVAALMKKHKATLPMMTTMLPHLEGISYETQFEAALDQVIAGIKASA
jgi:AcrR family transcriptional regulator